MDRAAELDLAHRFRCLSSVPLRSDLLKRCRTYDVGLALLARREWDINSLHMAGASNKAFDYASQGLAVIVPEEPEWVDLYVRTGCGKPCPPVDTVALAGLLDWMLTHSAEVRAMGEAGRQRCLKDWNYEAQFAPVLDLIEPADSSPMS